MPQTKSSTEQMTRNRVDEPRKYAVIIHNDDFTTMDFVVKVLVTVFRKEKDEAIALMLSVHHSDRAVVGVYPYDIAVSKADKATRMAREEGFPLKITCKPADE